MEQIVQFLTALSDEARLRIMMLRTQGELCVFDLMFVLDEPQSKVSRHLAYLKNSGILESKRVGVWMHYSPKDPSNGIYKAQIDLLREKLSIQPAFQKDIKESQGLRRHGGCKATIALKCTPVSKGRLLIRK